jgi:excisionase family DNA binding protein
VPKNALLITTAQVAELLRVDVRTVHRLTASGSLPHALKIPGQTGAYMFDREAVEKYRRERENTAA